VLAELPTDPAVLAVTEPRPVADRVLFLISRLAQIFSLDRFDLQVSGLDKLPSEGSYLICSNHQSFLDGLTLISVVPWPIFRRMFAVGTSEIFGSGLMRWVARIMRIVVVDPDANLIPAMRAGAYGLKRGGILILYPEGERSIDGQPKTFKKGAAILATHLQVPIVPVAIEGFHDAWPRGKPFQTFAPLRMKIGEPILPPPESTASEATYAALTERLRERVVKMWKELRG
jgi:1-acyl-sn-glycerol-3-phosphate acyltransferase